MHNTGHALLNTRNTWNQESILIIDGNLPLVTPDVIIALYAKYQEDNATIAFVTAHPNEPTHTYDSVVSNNNQISIVQASSTHLADELCCINAGIYLIRRSFLDQISTIINDTDETLSMGNLINKASQMYTAMSTVAVPFDTVRTVNTMQELWAAEHIKRSELIKYWMNKGVRFTFPNTTHIDLDVTIGSGTLIGSGVHLLRGTRIANNCIVGPFCVIENSTIHTSTTIYAHSVITDASIGAENHIGPFAHIRESSTIDNQVTIGNFVEVKKSTIGSYTKAKHLSYLGDSEIGQQVNIGAGTITCNHNGTTKEKTKIEHNAYIGSNTSLVAPVTIHENAFVAAGSVITHDVPAHALAIARSRQTNKLEYVTKIKEKKNKKDEEQTATEKDEHIFIGAKKLTAQNPLDYL